MDNADGDQPIMAGYPNREYIYEPPSIIDQALEIKLCQCFTKLQRIVTKARTHETMENLTHEEKRALKTLKSRNFIYLPSDKGCEFCIVETTIYDEAALAHLGDTTVYTPIRKMKAKTIESKINKT